MNNKQNIANQSNSKLVLLYFTILVTIMHICNIMAFKIINIHGYQFALTGIFFPISFLFLTVLTESYGHIEAQRNILYILISQTLLISIISIAIRINVHGFITTTNLYYDLYKNLYRLILSSNLAVGLSYYFTSFCNSKIKCWILGKKWWVRFLIANGIGKAILVLTTYPINFAGMMSWSNIMKIAVNTWVFKMFFAAIILGIIAPLFIKLNKKIDAIDMYDFGISYNPIKIYKSGNVGENRFNKKWED